MECMKPPVRTPRQTSLVPLLVVLGVLTGGVRLSRATAPAQAEALPSRPVARPYLGMPPLATGHIPPLLSLTGAFKDTRELIPSPSLLPYDINFPFWSDGAAKERWISIPNSPSNHCQIQLSSTGEWKFPPGTVLVKHFEFATDELHPGAPRRRLETRLVVCDATGSVYGVTYKWRPDNSDADLLTNSLREKLVLTTATGIRTQTWYYPSRQDCRTCHTDRAGGVLGVKTRQLNHEFTFPNGTAENEIRAWNHIGLFTPAVDEATLSSLPKLAREDAPNASLEARARSYLDANCSQCHRPGGTVAYFDARYDTPLAKQNLINGEVLFDQGLDHARVIAPHDTWRSVALLRIESLGGEKMPPLAHNVLDQQGIALLRAWIESLPGRAVLPPPSFSLPGGKYAAPVEIMLSDPVPGVTIRYTMDGSEPTSSDLLYAGPVRITGPTTVRAKAFKPGLTHSITVQQTYLAK